MPGLLQAALAKGEKGPLDLKQVDMHLADTAEEPRGTAAYIMGRFLERRGRAKDAVRYYRLTVDTAKAILSVSVLARNRLRALGAEPAVWPGPPDAMGP